MNNLNVFYFCFNQCILSIDSHNIRKTAHDATWMVKHVIALQGGDSQIRMKNNHPIRWSGSWGGYFLFSDRIDTINAANASIIIKDSKTVIRHHPFPLKSQERKRATTHENPITCNSYDNINNSSRKALQEQMFARWFIQPFYFASVVFSI